MITGQKRLPYLLPLSQVLGIAEELDYAPEWVCKALFRRGQAMAGKRNYERALKDFKAVLKLQPQVYSQWAWP